MFSHLSKYPLIFVTGPHRSGTTICSRIIAHDTGHDFVIEDEFMFSNAIQLAAFIHSNYGNMVIQCPFFCMMIDDLKYILGLDYDSAMIVMMRRNRDDIIASENRSRVDFEGMGRNEIDRFHPDGEFYQGHSSDMKYEFWDQSKNYLPNTIDVEYESLSHHCLWTDRHRELPFQHGVSEKPLPKGFRDGLSAIQD